MANPRQGEIDLEIGGETFLLVFDYNTIAEIEGKFNDRPINELFSTASGAVPMRVIREALRAGMDRRNRKRTSNEVGKMIGDAMRDDPGALVRIIKTVVEGVALAFGRTGEAPPEQAKEGDAKAEGPHPQQAPVIGGG